MGLVSKIGTFWDQIGTLVPWDQVMGPSPEFGTFLERLHDISTAKTPPTDFKSEFLKIERMTVLKSLRGIVSVPLGVGDGFPILSSSAGKD